MKKRKIPLRKCLGCGENKAKRELIRIVKKADNEILVDFTGKVNGRGAYICPNVDCLNESINTKRISKSLTIDISKETIERLKEDIENKIIN